VGDEEELVGPTTNEADSENTVGEHEDHGNDPPLEVLLTARRGEVRQKEGVSTAVQEKEENGGWKG
jgi:hypothetical protein